MRTYSSGMFGRLAFSVAAHLQPGDPPDRRGARGRRRRVQAEVDGQDPGALRLAGLHRADRVARARGREALAEGCVWLDRGIVALRGPGRRGGRRPTWRTSTSRLRAPPRSKTCDVAASHASAEIVGRSYSCRSATRCARMRRSEPPRRRVQHGQDGQHRDRARGAGRDRRPRVPGLPPRRGAARGGRAAVPRNNRERSARGLDPGARAVPGRAAPLGVGVPARAPADRPPRRGPSSRRSASRSRRPSPRSSTAAAGAACSTARRRSSRSSSRRWSTRLAPRAAALVRPGVRARARDRRVRPSVRPRFGPRRDRDPRGPGAPVAPGEPGRRARGARPVPRSARPGARPRPERGDHQGLRRPVPGVPRERPTYRLRCSTRPTGPVTPRHFYADSESRPACTGAGADPGAVPGADGLRPGS